MLQQQNNTTRFHHKLKNTHQHFNTKIKGCALASYLNSLTNVTFELRED
jgi:hypothetical protein